MDSDQARAVAKRYLDEELGDGEYIMGTPELFGGKWRVPVTTTCDTSFVYVNRFSGELTPSRRMRTIIGARKG